MPMPPKLESILIDRRTKIEEINVLRRTLAYYGRQRQVVNNLQLSGQINKIYTDIIKWTLDRQPSEAEYNRFMAVGREVCARCEAATKGVRK